jgi:hypothetical protein
MSYTMDTNLHLVARTLPSEYRKKLEVEFGEAFAEDEEVPDVPVEIEYEGGWSTPAKISGPPENCYPAEGEDPEIISVKIDGEHEFVESLTPADLANLVNMAWEDQAGYSDDGGY